MLIPNNSDFHHGLLVRAGAFFALLACLQLGLMGYFILSGPAQITSYVDNDDAYYYLQIAWNANKIGFVSFDGINKTNGVHFLWFWILYGLTFFTDDKAVFLQISRFASTLFTCLPYLVIWRLSSVLQNTRHALFGPIMALSWFVMVLHPRNRFLVGLESPLHAIVVWLLILQYLRLCVRHRSGQALGVWQVSVFSALLVANTWTRLDSFVVSGGFLVLFLYSFVYRRGRSFATSDRHLVVALTAGAAIVVTGAVLQLGFFWSAGDSLIPVSGLIKRHNAAQSLNLSTMYNWSQILFPVRIASAKLLNILGILAFCGSAGLIALSSLLAHDEKEQSLRRVTATLGISVLLYSVVIFGTVYDYFYWYLSPTFIFWVLVIGMVSDTALRTVRDRPALHWSILVALVLVLFWQVGVSPRTHQNPLYRTRYEAARWIDLHLDRDVVIGSFSAGQLGYFSNRSVVNLGGLVNDASYFRRVMQAPASALGEYLDDSTIEYIVDYQFGRWPSVVAERTELVQDFPTGVGDGRVQVLRMKEPHRE